MFKSEGGYTWVCMPLIEYDLLWCHDSAQVILNQNVDTINTNPLSERVLKVNYGYFWMVKSEGIHTWVGMHIVKLGILCYHDTAQGILNQSVNSKSTKPLSDRKLEVDYGHLF